jgi:hypothetical protein
MVNKGGCGNCWHILSGSSGRRPTLGSPSWVPAKLQVVLDELLPSPSSMSRVFFVFWYTSVNIHLFPSLFGPVHRQKVMRSYKNLKLTASLSAPHITLTLHIWISLILHIEVRCCIVAEFSLAETILKNHNM